MYNIGQQLFFVPIRYWEPENAIETGTVVANVFQGVEYSFEDERNVYVFHPDYGHNVYMSKDRTCATLEEANALRERMIAEKDSAEEAQMKIIMDRIFAKKRQSK